MIAAVSAMCNVVNIIVVSHNRWRGERASQTCDGLSVDGPAILTLMCNHGYIPRMVRMKPAR